MMPDYKVVEAHLKTIQYIKMTGKIRTWFCGDVVGFNAKATSLIRKPFTLERIKKEIEKHEIPVFVDDFLGEGYAAFRIMLKL